MCLSNICVGWSTAAEGMNGSDLCCRCMLVYAELDVHIFIVLIGF